MDNNERLAQHIKKAFKDNTINVNNKEYVSLDLFVDSIKDSMITEALLGITLKKIGPIVATDEEILMYMATEYDNTDIIYQNNSFRLMSK